MSLSSFLRKDSNRISTSEEIELMRAVSEAERIEHVHREITRLYRSLSYSLWGNLAKKFIPPRTELQLEDPYLDGWRKVLESRKQYNYPNSVYNWVFTIMLNNTLNVFKSVYEKLKILNPENATDSQSQALITTEIAGNITSVIEMIQADMIQRLIDDAIDNTLDVRERIAFKSYFYEDLKQAQIAKNMEISIGTVNTLIKSATQKIKYHLEKNGVEIDPYVK